MIARLGMRDALHVSEQRLTHTYWTIYRPFSFLRSIASLSGDQRIQENIPIGVVISRFFHASHYSLNL